MNISLGIKKDDVVNMRAISVPSLKKLSELICVKHYSLSTFLNSYRNKSNFLQAEAIGLDFDDGMSLEEAEEAFKDYAHIIAPTRSHGKDKNGVIADRFRVILLLDSPITDADTFEATWFSLANKFPKLDRSCKDASRFFYESQYIHAMREDGLKVEPVSPPPKPEKRTVDLATLPPGARGKLSKKSLAFLESGDIGDEAGRNRATFMCSKDLQQNLYSYEEAEDLIMSALTENGTIAPSFTEQEVVTTIRSAYNTEAKHEPRIKPKAFTLLKIGELYEKKSEMEWLVKDLLSVGGVSLLSADPKAGKSTIARQLMREVARGGSFLDRGCKKGSVFYFAIEEQIGVLNTSFKRLGVTEADSIFVHVGDPMGDNTFDDFRELLLETKPALAVIDTMFDFLNVESENNYKEVKRELRRLRAVARETGTHIMCIHHNSKGMKDDTRRGNRAILGSTAISGGVDTIMVVETDNEVRKITTSGREINRFVQYPLAFNKLDNTYQLGEKTERDPWE